MANESKSGTVRLQAHGADGIATVVLSNPGKLGAMSRAMWRELAQVFRAVGASDARCVIVKGEGGAFCAGGDISEYPAFRFEEEALREFHEDDVWGGLSAMLDCDVPLVALIEGACMGAGVEIASCCDVRIAEPGVMFGAPIAKLGFPMAPREAALVARAVGDGTARRMLLEAAVFTADEMKACGFLSQVSQAGEAARQAAASASRIASLAPQAARMNKRTLRALADDAAARLSATAYGYADSAEHREGIQAFIEKRKPVFHET